MSEITRILSEIGRGNEQAVEALMPLVYDELRQLAASRMARENPGHTLQPTALVHEAWLRVAPAGAGSWDNRAHFFSAAAEAMRRILIERARRRNAAKRGHGEVPIPLDAIEIPASCNDEEALLDLNEALDKLALHNPRKADLVKLRYFMGMSFQEAADCLGIAEPTAKQWWTYAKAWLRVELKGQPLPPAQRLR